LLLRTLDRQAFTIEQVHDVADLDPIEILHFWTEDHSRLASGRPA
jgi:hypothetical protein